MNGLKKSAIEVDRKVLADLAVFDKPAFAKFVELAKSGLGAANRSGQKGLLASFLQSSRIPCKT